MTPQPIIVAPCFCVGGTRYVVRGAPGEDGHPAGAFQVKCMGCGVRGPWAMLAETAAMKWDEMVARVKP